MDPVVYTPTYELFVVLEPLRRNFRRLCEAVDTLTSTDAPVVLGADIYYRATTDVALLALRYDERVLSYKALTWVLDGAAGFGIPILDPSKLGDTDRRQFYKSYLPSYPTRIDDLPGASAAMYELGRRLRLVPNIRARTYDEGPKPLPRPGRPRLATKEMFGAPASQPKRTPSVRASAPPGDAPVRASIPSGISPRGKLGPSHHSPDQRQSYSLVEQAAMARRAAAQRAATVPTTWADEDRTARDIPPLREVDETLQEQREKEAPAVARGKGKRRRRTETLPETPVARRAPSEPPAPDTARGTPREPAASSTAVPEPSDLAPTARTTAPPDIEVRYRRGGQWAMARLRSLSVKGAYLVTGALPRLGDKLTLLLSYREQRVTLHAAVYHITTVRDASQTGSAGFAVRFSQTASNERGQLIALLKRALEDGVRIKPPPSRQTVRFPVFWPIRVGSPRGGINVHTIDVSLGGMFFTTQRELGSDELVFRLPLDNGDSAIHGRARVARRIDETTARRRAMLPGYGVTIVDIDASSQRRYESFVARVQQRSQIRLLVAASEGRIGELIGRLAAVGYEVNGASKPHQLSRGSDLGAGELDLGILDASLGDPALREFHRVLSERNIRAIATAGESAEQTRQRVDRLLQIA